MYYPVKSRCPIVQMLKSRSLLVAASGIRQVSDLGPLLFVVEKEKDFGFFDVHANGRQITTERTLLNELRNGRRILRISLEHCRALNISRLVGVRPIRRILGPLVLFAFLWKRVPSWTSIVNGIKNLERKVL